MVDLDKRIELIEEQADTVSELFYKNKSSEGYMLFDKVLDSLSEFIDKLVTDDFKADENLKSQIVQCINLIMGALNDKDEVLIADLLQFELLPRLHDLKNS